MKLPFKSRPDTALACASAASGPGRIRHPWILPLEISDLWVEGATLWEWSEGERFAETLCHALKRWREGRPGDRWNEPGPAGMRGFDAVYWTGGRLEDDALRAKLAGFPFPAFFGDECAFGGERGGLEVLRRRGFSGWVADLGKSRLKLSANGWRKTFPRDWKRMPPAQMISEAQVPAQRRRLREFLAMALRWGLAETGLAPRALVAALPARLNEDGTPGESNYAGMQGDGSLLGDAVALAGWPGLPAFVLNDAELAAWSVLSDSRLAGLRKVLVVTLGFGIGAAVIDRGEPTGFGG